MMYTSNYVNHGPIQASKNNLRKMSFSWAPLSYLIKYLFNYKQY
jgi:hypothetical protein